jgi:hypothetical protein
MPQRDYRDIASKLRRKAADPAVTEEEKKALYAKAEELNSRYGKNVKFLESPWYYDKLEEIIESGYSMDGDREDWW